MPKTKKRKTTAPSQLRPSFSPYKSSQHQSRSKTSALAKSSHSTAPTIPFDATSRILLIGEGDFSFAKSIVQDHGCCDVTATCLDSQSELYAKYAPQAEEHVSHLEDEGQTVIYGVDAMKLDSNKHLRRQIAQGETFDVVIFNFPHVGGKSKDVNRQVRFNQELLVKFFASCLPLLTDRESEDAGTVLVTLFEGEPYTLWNIRDLARHSGLEVVRSFRFVAGAYPGYRHSRTLGNIEGGGGWKGEDREARTYVFRRRSKGVTRNANMTEEGVRGGDKRKRAELDSDDDGVG